MMAPSTHAHAATRPRAQPLAHHGLRRLQSDGCTRTYPNTVPSDHKYGGVRFSIVNRHMEFAPGPDGQCDFYDIEFDESTLPEHIHQAAQRMRLG